MAMPAYLYPHQRMRRRKERRGGEKNVEDIQRLHAHQPVARQRQIRSNLPIQSWQEKAPPHVRKEPDDGLGHRKHGALGRNPEGRVHRQADAAAHSYTIHESNVRLLVGCDQVVELVLEAEESGRLLHALGTGRAELCERLNVPAGAKRFSAGAFDDDDVGDLGLGPFLRRFREDNPGRARGGVRTWRRGTIFSVMDSLRALSFPGRLSSMVRTPRLELKRTSSGSYGCGVTGFAEVDIYAQDHAG